MSRKIVICPSFASSHILKQHIQNCIDAIDPDIIIYNEGLFPNGPENKGHVDSKEFKEKYCYGGTNCGFDWEESLSIVVDFDMSLIPEHWSSKMVYQGERKTVNIINTEYDSSDVNECFLLAISNNEYGDFEPEPGDIIFPLEPDAFHHEKDKDKINELISQLKPGEGLQTQWVDFLGTQYYTEAINVTQPKWRRFAYCFDNMENYRSAMSGFMSQNYPKLKKVSDFITYHYPWFVYGKWKELRYDLIYRSNPQYWKDFEIGLQAIKRGSEFYVRTFYEPIPDKPIPSDKIIIRPSRSDEGRFAQFIDIEHPNAIKSHPNFVK